MTDHPAAPEGPQPATEVSRAPANLRPGRRPGWMRLSHEYTAFSATLLLMISVLLSRVIGLVRIKVIAYLFGAASLTDAYTAAFQLPDMLSYFLVGGTASVTFITILSRYREQGREREGEQALSVIVSVMLLVLTAAIVVGEIFAPYYIRFFFHGFDAEKVALAAYMTRILLPIQLCLLVGGVLAAVLLVRKQFAWQAISPLIYNLGIILGGVLLAKKLGVPSLAYGALAGAIVGPLLLNYVGTRRLGVRLRFSLDWSNPGLREWLRMSIPLMVGVSLVSADQWILNYFASVDRGGIAKLMYAKTLFSAPMAIVGQAAGAASMPFLASLIGQRRNTEFASTVNRIVTRIFAFSFLLSAWMVGLATPAVDLILRGGSLHRAEIGPIALYFILFAGSLCFWATYSIYARAFYATGDTLTPMVASTLIVIAFIPLYWFLFHRMGVPGLAVASDCGIAVQTLVLAVLLHRKRLVSSTGLEYGELARSLVAAALCLGALYGIAHVLPQAGSYTSDVLQLVVGTVIWIGLAWLVLHVTRSKLPRQLTQRMRRRDPAVAPTPLEQQL